MDSDAQEVLEENEISFKLNKEELECPICLGIPDSLPIYQCQEGHVICNSCHSKINTCPVCRVSLNFKIRALGMEKILRKIVQKCKHIGCNKFSVDIDEHEANCEFAPSLAIKCPKCQEVVFTKDALQHLDKHQKEPKGRGEIYIMLWLIFFLSIVVVVVIKEVLICGCLLPSQYTNVTMVISSAIPICPNLKVFQFVGYILT